MKPACTLIFPHQLFERHPGLQAGRLIILVEEWLFFKQYRFHPLKLHYHRASMWAYRQWLLSNGYEVEYLNAEEVAADSRFIGQWLASRSIGELHLAWPADDWLQKRLQASCQEAGIRMVEYDSPGFLLSPAQGEAFFRDKTRFHQTDFYIWQRKRLNILLDGSGRPLGGKWTYDTENRERLPKGIPVPALPAVREPDFFPETPEQRAQPLYPFTHAGARAWLQRFLEERLAGFGPYEDAMVAGESYLFHSVLTPMLNTGLLTPAEVVETTLRFAATNPLPLNSLEGFIRQVTGWREFIHQVYHRAGRQQRTRNFWGFTRKIPASFYTGTTGIVPVDQVIRKLLSTAYNHHIERLMVLGNFMLLCEFDPDEVYRWFMEMYIDAYDWVMVPNVYGMTQFADGGLMTTKPYISGSNYLLKMGDWPKGPWQETWDGLFWRFLHVHRDFFLSNPRLGMLVKTFDKMPAARQQQHLSRAASFLEQLDAKPTLYA